MAKADNVSFLERHVEKLVLLACLALLAAAAYRWVLSSPVGLAVISERGRGKTTAGPEQVDQVLQGAAQRVKHLHDVANLQVDPVPKWAGKVVTVGHFESPRQVVVDPAMPRLPMKVDVGRASKGMVRLAQLIAVMPVPPAPKVAASMHLPEKDTLADLAVAHGSLVYPLAGLTAAWEELLKKKVAVKAVVQDVLVEAQEELPDGQWGPIRRVNVVAKPGADGNSIVVPKVRPFDGKNVEEVRKDRDAVAQQQDHILRPEYFRVWQSGWKDWRALLPKVQPGENEIQVWFHDEAMKIGRRYRYRVRLVFVNPILTYDKAVGEEHLAEARQTHIRANPSAWSKPVSVNRNVRFFLTGASETTGQMTVTIFAHKWGQRVMKTFRVRPGEPIGAPAKVGIRNPKSGKMEGVTVDFSTGTVSLQFRFDVKYAKGSFDVTTARMLYLDRQGRLQALIQARDNDSPLRKRLFQEVKQAAVEK